MSDQSTEDEFFQGKRPWSKIKDQVLGGYLPPYLRKVAKLGRRIILIDCFAGPGKFQDGSHGSPLVMCGEAQKHAAGRCIGVFVNKEKAHHERLTQILGTYIRQKIAYTILGDSQDLLKKITEIAQKDTLFIYLDPFGLRGCEFGVLKALLERGNQASTEILVNLSMPTFHRLAARKAVAEGRGESALIRSFHRTLDGVLGGDYWRKYAFDDKLRPEEKERKVMEEYQKILRGLLPYAGSCPVQEASGSRVKYYITFCSRHPDAMRLMNDIMFKAYNEHLHWAALADMPLLACVMPDWQTQRERALVLLKRIVLEVVQKRPGRTRMEAWDVILSDHFMKFAGSEYRSAVQELVEKGYLTCPTPHKTKRLNDDCVLNPGKEAAS